MISAKAITLTGHYKTDIALGNKTLLADEPVENGGSDSGPTPTQLLVSALACCTSITLRMYADRKGIALTKIEVEVSLIKDAETSLSSIKREIKLEANLSDEQTLRFIQIANACPVSKLLSNETKINTTIV